MAAVQTFVNPEPLGSADDQQQCQTAATQITAATAEAPAGLWSGLKFVGNRGCPFAHRSWWVAEELGLIGSECEYVHVDFVEKTERGTLWVSNDKPEWYVENLSPLATIPTLLDEGVPYMALKGAPENDVISDYLLARHGGGCEIVPSDPARHGLMRRTIARLATLGVIPAMYALLSSQDPEQDPALAASLWSKLLDADAMFSEADAAGPFLFGAEPSLADSSIMPFLDRFSTTLRFYRGFVLLPERAPGVARLRAMLAAARDRPAFRRTSQSPEFYVNFYRSYGSRRGASTDEEKERMATVQAGLTSGASL